MTDISELREGDEIEAVVRLTITRGIDLNRWHGLLIVRDKDGAVLTGLKELVEIAESITAIRPEISVGQPYVADDGRLYVGRVGERVVHIDDNNAVKWYGTGYGPLPAGLRPAKVVAE